MRINPKFFVFCKVYKLHLYLLEKTKKEGEIYIMWKYVLKRVGLALVTTFIILSLTFILMKLVPYERPLGMANAKYAHYAKEIYLGYVEKTTELIKGREVLWNYDGYYYYQVPVFQQYFRWLGNIVTKWHWGTSLTVNPNLSATTIIANRIPVSMSLNIISTLFSVPLGILLGIWAALKKNKPTDTIISTTVMILISVPSFVLITFLILFFGYWYHILPTQWPSPTAPLGTKVLGYILPVTALSLGSIAGYCRFTRAELCEVMSSDYLLLARTKGLTKRQAILRHALRNAMVPIVPAILAEFLSIMGGSMILETLYGIPGIGSLFLEALNGKDYNVLFVDMAIFTTFGLMAGILLDISYGFIDPRIRMGAKK